MSSRPGGNGRGGQGPGSPLPPDAGSGRPPRRPPKDKVGSDWKPSWGLTITVVAPLAALALWRAARRALKAHRVRAARRALRPQQPALEEVVADNANGDNVHEHADEDLVDLALPGPARKQDGAALGGTWHLPKPVRSRNALRWASLALQDRLPGLQISVGQALFLLAVAIAATAWVYLWPGTLPARRAWGSVAASLMLLTIVPATRNSLLWFLDLPVERSIVFHRWLGRMTFVAAAIHGACYIGFGLDRGDSLAEMWARKRYRFGLLAGGALAVVTISSLPVVRRRWYNTFRVLHFAYVPFLVCVALHARQCVPFVAAAAVFYAFDLGMRCVSGSASPARALSVEALPGGVTRVRVAKSGWRSSRAGQFIFVNIPALSLGWHPFTVSSGPLEGHLEVHAKAAGDLTARLHALAKRGDQLPVVRVDGPYGRLGFKHHRYETLILVAGGIGITPHISVLRELFQLGVPADTRRSLASNVRRVCLVWTIREADSWLCFEDTLDAAMERSARADWPAFEVHLFVTGHRKRGATELEQGGLQRLVAAGHQVHLGRVDPVAQLGRLLGTLSRPQRLAVMACGPRGLVDATWDACMCASRLGPHQADFHGESFRF